MLPAIIGEIKIITYFCKLVSNLRRSCQKSWHTVRMIAYTYHNVLVPQVEHFGNTHCRHYSI